MRDTEKNEIECLMYIVYPYTDDVIYYNTVGYVIMQSEQRLKLFLNI